MFMQWAYGVNWRWIYAWLYHISVWNFHWLRHTAWLANVINCRCGCFDIIFLIAENWDIYILHKLCMCVWNPRLLELLCRGHWKSASCVCVCNPSFAREYYAGVIGNLSLSLNIVPEIVRGCCRHGGQYRKMCQETSFRHSSLDMLQAKAKAHYFITLPSSR